MRYENSGNQWNLEAVFWTGISPDFSGHFRPAHTIKKKKLLESQRKIPKTFQPKILFPYSIDFRSFPAGTDLYAFTYVESYFVSVHKLHFFFLFFILLFSTYIYRTNLISCVLRSNDTVCIRSVLSGAVIRTLISLK
jgi:hypothetical protein